MGCTTAPEPRGARRRQAANSALARLRRVRGRLRGRHQLTGVSLDPPYCHTLRSNRLYREDSPALSSDVRAWALERGTDPLLRITLAGKGEEHDELLAAGWSKHVWRSDGETIWASPLCERVENGPLFAGCS